MLCMGGLFLAQLFPLIGKPLAELTANGIKTPLYGMISWSDIEGFSLYCDRRSSILILIINEFMKKKLFPLNKKSFGLFSSRYPPQEIRILLTPSNESPEVIETIARFLWTQARATEFSQDVEKRVEKIQALYKSGDLEALELPRMEQLQRSEQVSRDLETRERLRKHEFKKSMWKICTLIFSAVILVFIRFKYFG